jgi:transcriptional regulator with XRE-family HTH domain
MPTSVEHQALERARWLAKRIGQEVATARKAHGWSQRELAERAAVSQSAVSRVERGWPEASIELMTRLCMMVGLDFSARAFVADGVVIRDERQMTYVALIVARAHAAYHPTIEMPVGSGPGDRRAIDLVLASAVEVWATEVERDLADFQMQLRADQLKAEQLAQREARPVRFVLALPATRRLREIVLTHEPVVRAALPASSRQIWACLRAGRPLGSNGLLWLPPTMPSTRSPSPSPAVESGGTQVTAR